MNCKEATKSYEAWLAIHTRLIQADLQLRHQQMSADIFSFMRVTFYRWVEIWTEHCAPLANAPAVLAIGDLHVENFGTWRDQEGRIAASRRCEMQPMSSSLKEMYYVRYMARFMVGPSQNYLTTIEVCGETSAIQSGLESALPS